jgi:signal peptidase complex subunit 2
MLAMMPSNAYVSVSISSGLLLTPVQYLSRPNLFKQIHLHTDVRLALGWAGVIVASVTGLYGWKVDFEQSKPGVWAGFILYESFDRLTTTLS